MYRYSGCASMYWKCPPHSHGHIIRDVNIFIFMKNDCFVKKTIVFLKFVFKNGRFLKDHFFNDNPSLTIVNEERKPT